MSDNNINKPSDERKNYQPRHEVNNSARRIPQDRRTDYSKRTQTARKSSNSHHETNRPEFVSANKNNQKSNKYSINKGAGYYLWGDTQHRAKNIFGLLAVIFIVVTIAVGFVSGKLDLIDNEKPEKNKTNNLENYTKVDVIYDDEALIEAKTVNDAYSYTDFSKKWATNGSPIRSSKNVINVLLIGLDSDEALEKGGRSDSMILASLNKKEKKIYLTSFYRDTWTYMNTGGVETTTKMNAAYMYGKDDGIVSTLENNFKIHIDYYVTVDFSSFTDIINTLGGITVKVEQYEAEYINRTSVHNIEWGDAVKLDGWEALVFARIRKSDGDSDVSRTRRQRIVISSFVNSVKDANIKQINEILNKLFGYVRTDLSKMEILSYGVQGLTNGWAGYEIESVLLNDPSIYRTGWVGNSSVVFVNFPAVSETVQKAIYGDSSVIAEKSQNPFNFMSQRSNGEWQIG